MGKVIQLFKTKPLTTKQIIRIEKRIDEIINILDITEDDDIIDNLEAELNSLKIRLEQSYNESLRRERLCL